MIKVKSGKIFIGFDINVLLWFIANLFILFAVYNIVSYRAMERICEDSGMKMYTQYSESGEKKVCLK